MPRSLAKSNIPASSSSAPSPRALSGSSAGSHRRHVKVAFHETPLVAFIDAVFEETAQPVLRRVPGLQDKKDLVTSLLSPEPLAPPISSSGRVGRCAAYGVDIREEGGILTFFESEEIASPEIPLLITGKALPEVPDSHRTIFQLVHLRIANPNFVSAWIRRAFQGQDIEIDYESGRGALFLQGGAEIIAQVVDMIEVLDQPILQGKNGTILQPAFLDAANLADELTTVMVHEGYDIGVGRTAAVTLLRKPNKLVIFVNDRPNSSTSRMAQDPRRAPRHVEEALFSYEVQNTQPRS